MRKTPVPVRPRIPHRTSQNFTNNTLGTIIALSGGGGGEGGDAGDTDAQVRTAGAQSAMHLSVTKIRLARSRPRPEATHRR